MIRVEFKTNITLFKYGLIELGLLLN